MIFTRIYQSAYLRVNRICKGAPHISWSGARGRLGADFKPALLLARTAIVRDPAVARNGRIDLDQFSHRQLC